MKNNKHIWLPLAILVYAIVMGYVMIRRNGVTREFWITTAVELLIVIALFFVLRWQQRRRERD